MSEQTASSEGCDLAQNHREAVNYFDSLPDHLVEKILGYLYKWDLKKAALVGKRWNKIIGTSFKLMDGFRLNIRSRSRTHANPRIVTFQRLYRQIEFDDFPIGISNLLGQTLKRIGGHVTTAVLSLTFSRQNIATILECFPALVDVHLVHSERMHRKIDWDPDSFNHVKKISCSVSFEKIAFLSGLQFTALHIRGTVRTMPDFGSLMSFVSTQTRLDSLSFSIGYLLIPQSLQMEPLRSQVKVLYIDCEGIKGRSDAFFEIFSNSVEVLKLCFSSGFSMSIFNNYNSLKEVSLTNTSIILNQTCKLRLPNVKIMDLCDCVFMTDFSFEIFFASFPGLEDLKIDEGYDQTTFDVTPRTITNVTWNLKHVKTVTFSYGISKMWNFASFENLETFNANMWDYPDFKLIIANNQKLKMINVQDIYEQQDLQDLITHARPNMKITLKDWPRSDIFNTLMTCLESKDIIINVENRFKQEALEFLSKFKNIFERQLNVI